MPRPDDASDTTYFNQRNYMQGLTVSEVDLWFSASSYSREHNRLVAWNLFCQKTESFSFTATLLWWRKYLVKRDARKICQENLVVKIIYLFNIERKKLYIYTFAKLQSSRLSSYLFPVAFEFDWPFCRHVIVQTNLRLGNIPLCHGSMIIRIVSPISLIDMICAKIQCVNSYPIKLILFQK